MKNQIAKKLIALSLSGLLAFTAADLSVGLTAVQAADVPAATYDATIPATLSMKVGQSKEITFPSTNSEGGKLVDSWVVKTSDKTVVVLAKKDNPSDPYVEESTDTCTYDWATKKPYIQFTAKKSGTAKVTITSKSGSEEVGQQTANITVTAPPATLTGSQTVLSTGYGGALAADGTVTIPKGEVATVSVSTDAAGAVADDFGVTSADKTVASVVTQAGSIGSIASVPAVKPVFSSGSYTFYIKAEKTGETTFSVTEDATSDGLSGAASFAFKVKVINRDGELSATYDADGDGTDEKAAATYYDGTTFVSGNEKGDHPKDATPIALDLTSAKTIKVTGTSANGQTVSYVSDTPAVATVSNTGLITAVGAGTANVTVKTAAATNLKASEITIPVRVSEKPAAFITVKDSEGKKIASSAGTFNGSSVPPITVGGAIPNDAQAFLALYASEADKEIITHPGNTIILSTKDNTTKKLSVTTNASDYLTAASANSGIASYSNGTLTAVAPGSTTLSFKTTANSAVTSTSEITINVYVTDLNMNNTITAKGVSVDAKTTTATIEATSTYGTPVFAGYVYDDEEGLVTHTAGDFTIDSKGKVTYTPIPTTRGTVYAKVSVANSDKALGAKDVFVPITYSSAITNKITVTGAENDTLSVEKDKTKDITVSATDTKTTFNATVSDETVATATVTGNTISVKGLKKGTTIMTITGKAGSSEYDNPESKMIVINVADAASVLTVDPKNVDVTIGTTGTITASSTNTAATITYVSNDESIATVSATGVVTGVAAGTTYVTVSDGYDVKIVTVTVGAKKAVSFKNTSKTYKASALKKAKKSFSVIKASGGGKVTYKVTKGTKKFISVSKKGVVTLKKGTKKGTYKVKITVAAKGAYKKTTKTITIKVK